MATAPPSQIDPSERRNTATKLQSLATDEENVARVTDSSPADPSTSPKPAEPVLRYRKTPFWLLAGYLITLVLPWVFICVLDARPLPSSSYHDQRSRVTPDEYRSYRGLLAFLRAMSSISGVLTIPVTTAILGYAAVTYAQKRYDGQKLSIAQLFALSDRGWADINVLWRAHSTGGSRVLLWLGFLLILIGSVQQPLQSALVSLKPVVAVSCADIPIDGKCDSNATIIGYDADPAVMAFVEHRLIVQEVANSLVTFDNLEYQHDLWTNDPYEGEQLLRWTDFSKIMANDNGGKPSAGSRYFVSSLPRGTRTGVLREHALRLNSSITCKSVPRRDFPSQCAGSRPLEVEIRRSDVKMRVCVPGEIGRHPWTLSRDRQDIEEELFMDFGYTEDRFTRAYSSFKNFTVHCTASTVRGYFELGNVMNEFVYGPLLDKWPDEQTIERDTNDFTADRQRMTETDDNEFNLDELPFYHDMYDPFGVGRIPAAGPLMMAANALFGNTSFLQLAYTNSTAMSSAELLKTICNYGDIPFTQLTGTALSHAEAAESYCRAIIWDEPPPSEEFADRQVGRILGIWISYFAFPYDARDLLDMAMFLVNRAVLQKTVSGATDLYARPVWTSPGTVFEKPSVSLGSTIGISILIFLQSVGLAAAVWYSRKAPTWTATFDSMALARIGRAMKAEDLPPIGPVGDKDRARLSEANALVGIADGGEESGGTIIAMKGANEQTFGDAGDALPPETMDSRSSGRIRLTLGGAGNIDDSHAQRGKGKT